MLLLWAEALQAGYITYRLQLHPVFGSAGRAGLQLRPQQSELLSVCRAVHQDAAGRGPEQEEEGELQQMSSTDNQHMLHVYLLS